MPRHEYDEDADRFLPARDRAEHYNALPLPVVLLILGVAVVMGVVGLIGLVFMFR